MYSISCPSSAYLGKLEKVCSQLSSFVRVTLSFSVPSANNLIVAESASFPTQTFLTGTDIFSVLVFVTVKPFSISPVIEES